VIVCQLGLQIPDNAIEDVHVQASLPAYECGKQADRPRTRDEDRPGRPGGGTPADSFDMVPRLGHNARRFEKHADMAELRIDFDCKRRLDPKPLEP
jgi:hypothetical protein